MNKKSFEELLEELNKEERKKFDYILNFYTEEHVFYNFEFYRHALKEFNMIRYENFERPLENRYKRLANGIGIKSICDNFENFRTYWETQENKEVTDFLIFMTNYNKVSKRSVYTMIEKSKKYKKLIEKGIISPEEIFEIITTSFESFSDPEEKIDLLKVEQLINDTFANKLNGKIERSILEDSLRETEISQRIIILSPDLLKRLSQDDIREAYAFQGNVQSTNKSILAIKAIMGERFKSLDDSLAERLKSMLGGFNLLSMKDSEIEFFRLNLDDIINKGYNIEDIFFVKNIRENQAALKAFSELPENLQRQVLKVNVVAKKSEIANVLSALTECREETKTTPSYEFLERNISRLPLNKRQELRASLENKKVSNYKTKLNLDSRITMGFELEVQGLMTDVVEKLKEEKDVYKAFKNKQNILNGFDGWKIDYDGTVPNGLELISPVLSDNEKDWNSLKDACDSLKALGATIDDTCGGHIHIGADILGSDEKAWKNLFEIWENAEEFMYKISTKSGENLRKEVGFQAAPTQAIIQEMFDSDSIKINSYNDVIKIADEYTRRYMLGYSSSGRTKSMNLQCIAEGKQNTIEFRIPNGSVDAEEIQKTANLYARIVQTSKRLSEDPEYKKDIFEKFKISCNEEKLSYFLDLIFDDIEDKMVYYDRYFSQDRKLMLSGKSYDEIVEADVAINKTEKYEWRGHR